jgi:hypothetical protein
VKVKILYSLGYEGLEKEINSFLEENEGRIEIVDIKWQAGSEQFAMIIYNSR